MNNELYKMLTLDRVRGFANKDELHFGKEDLSTIIVWLNNLKDEVDELEKQFRAAWWEKQ